MNLTLDWKMVVIVVAFVAAFVALALKGFIDHATINMVAASFGTYVLGLYTDRKRKDLANGQQ